MAALPNAVRPLLRFRITSSCVSRRWATTSSTSSVASSSKRTILAQPSNAKSNLKPPPALEPPVNPVSTKLPPELLRKQWYATKLYDAGRRAIYRPPSQAGIYAASYIIAGSCILTAGGLAFSNFWAYDPTSDLPWFVSVAWRLGIMVFTFIGGFAFLRSTRFIKSMDLVSVGGVVKLAIQVRRPLPFLRPKEYVIAPYEFKMDSTFVRQLEEPAFMHEEAATPPKKGIALRIVQAISKSIYYPVASTRRLMTLEGFMTVKLDQVSGSLKLDTQGSFSNDAKDLVEMGSIVF